MPPWLTVALEAVEAAPTVFDSLLKLFQHVHNEMTHGSGATAPAAITQAITDNIQAIHDAVVANTPAAAAAGAIGSVAKVASKMTGGTVGKVLDEAGTVAGDIADELNKAEAQKN